jgi:hypothetical protein
MPRNEAIAADVAAMFAEVGQDATYNDDPVRVVPGRFSLITEGSMRKWVRSFVVRVSEVAEPSPGDVIVCDDTTWTVGDPGGEPVTGGRVVWTVQAIKQRRPTFRG